MTIMNNPPAAELQTHATIGGNEYTLFYDYDREVLKTFQLLDDDGKIEWLALRMKMIFLDPVRILFDDQSAAYAELNYYPASGRGARTGMFLSLSTLLNGVEALGSYLTRASASNNSRFLSFARKYLAAWSREVAGVGRGDGTDLLWTFYRNPLTHGFQTKAPFGIESRSDEEACRIDGAGILQINPIRLFREFDRGVTQFFGDVRVCFDVRKHFLERFNGLFPP